VGLGFAAAQVMRDDGGDRGVRAAFGFGSDGVAERAGQAGEGFAGAVRGVLAAVPPGGGFLDVVLGELREESLDGGLAGGGVRSLTSGIDAEKTDGLGTVDVAKKGVDVEDGHDGAGAGIGPRVGGNVDGVAGVVRDEGAAEVAGADGDVDGFGVGGAVVVGADGGVPSIDADGLIGFDGDGVEGESQNAKKRGEKSETSGEAKTARGEEIIGHCRLLECEEYCFSHRDPRVEPGTATLSGKERRRYRRSCRHFYSHSRRGKLHRLKRAHPERREVGNVSCFFSIKVRTTTDEK